jgi:tRNA threonylcarbamoyladenosine biosynthesis protein TsaB
MANLLLMETATGICSIGISKNDQVVALKAADKAYQHTTVITILIQEVLDMAEMQLTDLDAIALSNGPGSFTSLRVGSATAKGICYSLNKPLIAVDTLQSLALASKNKLQIDAIYIPMIDARRMEVYTAAYDHNNVLLEPLQAMIVNPDRFDKWLKEGKKIVLCGDGAEKCKTILSNDDIVFDDTVCSAAFLLPLANQQFQKADFEEVAYYSPTYLKPPNITRAKKRL